MKNKLVFSIFSIISFFFFYTILSIVKYSILLGFSDLSFQEILQEMIFMRIFLSFILSFITVYIISIITKNIELAKQQQQMIQTMSSNNEKILNRFEDFVNLLPEGLYETDTERKITFVSDNLAKQFGYKKNELVGCNIEKFLSITSVKKALEEYKNRTNGVESNGSSEYDLIDKSGKTRTVLIQSIPRKDLTGKIIGTRGIILDISELVKLKKDYKKSYHMMKLLIDAISLPVFLQNINGEITYFNKAFTNFCNKTEQDIQNKTVFDIFSNEIASIFYKNMSDFMRTRNTIKDFYLKYNDKQVIVSQSKYINEDHKYDSGIISLIQDNSQIEYLKKDLEFAQETFKVLSEQSLLGIAITKNNTTHYINEKMSEILGYKENEISFSQDFFRKIIHEKDFDRLMNQISKVNSNKHINCHVRLMTKSGALKHIEIELKKIKYDLGEAFLYIIIDITPFVNIALKNKIMNKSKHS